MGFQTISNRDFGIAACTVENPAKLWKAPRAMKEEKLANPCNIRAFEEMVPLRSSREKTPEQWKTFVF
jgi:hypothetical protein